MKKWIFSVSILLCASFSFIETPHEHMTHAELEFAPKSLGAQDRRYIEPYSVQVDYLTVRPMEVRGFKDESMVKLEKAFEVLEKVVNSEEFKNRILNFVNSQGQASFASNQGLSNSEIYKLFMEGREVLQPNTPGEMNFFLKLYYKRYTDTVGWTEPGINQININWKFFKKYRPNQVAGNLAHEWTHKMGFKHKSAAEHDSAPYAIGYIVREMGERYLKGEEIK